MDAPTLADRIVFWRQRAGLTRDKLAAELGLTPPAVSNWMAGRNNPGYDMIEKIAKVCGVTLPVFFGPLPVQRGKRKARG